MELWSSLLKETHFSIEKENALANNFTCLVFFSLGASNSCGVLIACLRTKYFVLNKSWKNFDS